ncbi:MarR family winged helix-turn-helix transcriptional regulator [Micromonospora sp. NPDC051141]|uniref:MarR family winged helix-turn-helix transcriptional regulator n=1 Tax=Micromonospora sp. NPDC051141 TaxID=3364284 RepID=UPI0037A3635B
MVANDAECCAVVDARSDEGTSPRSTAWPAGQVEWCGYLNTVQRSLLDFERGLRRACGLSLSDYYVLTLLAIAADRRMRLKALARELQVNPSRVTYLVDSLQGRGLVDREPSSDDGRGVLVRLTDVGLEAVRAAYPHHATASQKHAQRILMVPAPGWIADPPD